MINVGLKNNTLRFARAEGYLKTRTDIIRKIKSGDIPKGDVLENSRAAGIQAAKKTAELLIFCHNLPLDYANVHFEMGDDFIRVEATAQTISRTGVEMEALTAVNIALLNVYDMLKPLDKEMEITGIRLLEKKGGKSEFDESFDHPIKASILRISEPVAKVGKKDRAMAEVLDFLKEKDIEITRTDVISADPNTIREFITKRTESDESHLLFTVGGTGVEERVPIMEITRELIETEIPGIAEGMRAFGMERTPYAMFLRNTAGIIGKTLVINLPGSSGGAVESLHALFPGIKHALRMMNQGKLRNI